MGREYVQHVFFDYLLNNSQKIINKDILYGSWAGAFGNFQFMPRTIRNYAIDYNENETIELKKSHPVKAKKKAPNK